jgi:hypothetical protein
MFGAKAESAGVFSSTAEFRRLEREADLSRDDTVWRGACYLETYLIN